MKEGMYVMTEWSPRLGNEVWVGSHHNNHQPPGEYLKCLSVQVNKSLASINT